MTHINLVFFTVFVVLISFGGTVFCQTQNKNGNPTGEIGQPAFDEIIVESTLTVRGKSGSRSGKSLITNVLQESKPETVTTEKTEEVKGLSLTANRSRRSPQRYGSIGGQPYFKSFMNPNPGYRFPSLSSSAAQASSNAFNQNTPFGNFGSSASQASSQSQNFGPDGVKSSTGHSAAQSYYLPNGNRIDVSFSQSFTNDKGRPNFANSHAVTITSPDGKVHKIA